MKMYFGTNRKDQVLVGSPFELNRLEPVDAAGIDNWQATLSHYLFASHWLAQGLAKSIKMGNADYRSHEIYRRTLWPAVRDARLFDFTVDDHVDTYNRFSRFTTEGAGCKYRIEPEDHLPAGPELDAENDKVMRWTNTVGASMPMPELPFESVWLGFGAGRMARKMDYVMRGWSTFPDIGWISALLLNRRIGVHEFLICFVDGHPDEDGSGTIGIFYEPKYVPSTPEGIEFHEACDKGLKGSHKIPGEPLDAWRTPYDLTPWIANSLMARINSCRTYVAETPGLLDRQAMKSAAKAFGKKSKRHRPPPYYRIALKDTVIHEIEDRLAAASIPRELDHQYDRRSHERVRVMRGPLPLTDETRKKIESRRKSAKGDFRFFEEGPLDPETRALLGIRAVPPKRGDEWMTVVVTKVREHKVPSDDNKPEGMPYIPAIRVAEASTA